MNPGRRARAARRALRRSPASPTGLAIALALAALAPSVALLAPTPARGHTRSLSYSSWDLSPGSARIQVRLTALDLSGLPLIAPAESGHDPVATYLTQHLLLLADGKPCTPMAPPSALPASSGWVIYDWSVTCPPGSAHELRSDVLLAQNPSHLHFARARLPDGRVLERVLSTEDRAWPLPDLLGAAADRRGPRAAGTSFAGYVALGVEHILTGWDHLAFVLALLLLARTVGEVAALVTAFTVAHSVTLGLAVLGVVHPDARAVEALIGFSIALVAAENAWLLGGRDRLVPATTLALLVAMSGFAAAGIGAIAPLALLGLGFFALCHFALLDRAERPGRLRAAVAFAFGLAHGFGFAGVLAAMELPRERLVAALLGFNVGVELGQLAVVLVAWPLLRAGARLGGDRVERLVVEAGSAAICGLGLFWFLVRTYG